MKHSPQNRSVRPFRRTFAWAAALLPLAVVGEASASPIVWTGSQSPLAASASFDVSGPDLVITLSNTSASDVTIPAQVLTSVFFNVSGAGLSLTPSSAIIPSGSTVLFGGTDPGGVVGGEWAYKSGLPGAPGSGSYGVSSAGLGLFGPGDRFPGNNLSGPTNPGGLEYGITSAGDNPVTGNSPVTGGNALIQSQVVFHLAGLPANFDLTRISGVTFQYGTDTGSEPSVQGHLVPAPGALAMLGIGAGTLARRRRR